MENSSKQNQEMMKKLNDLLFSKDINSIININLHIINRNDLPGVELRKSITDMGIIKQLTNAALEERPIILIPKFTDKIKSINSLLSKGIIFHDEEDNKYKFNF